MREYNLTEIRIPTRKATLSDSLHHILGLILLGKLLGYLLWKREFLGPLFSCFFVTILHKLTGVRTPKPVLQAIQN